ncbi:hypothetical protein [Chelatococcus sp.]|uniref:hypothetical protein n=1 Tax=Chelatococcus sp. TaxID=1953771 RepID=UPI001ECDE844|nr:hypothetical protein [Chelatococcus sp.]MBX3546899.1 hypothetical protein [Chelatococcus sp.]
MAVKVKVDPIDRDIALALSSSVGPEARSKIIADFAREELAKAQVQNKQALGHETPHTAFVDGQEGAPLDSVKPDGRIVFEFDLVNEIFAWIGEQLVLHSPVLTGRYRGSHKFYADGVEIEPGLNVPDAQEYAFVNIQPYARKIERGFSEQAPDGVFEAVAALANARFGNMARIRFSYRTVAGSTKDPDTRQPAVIITLR